MDGTARGERAKGLAEGKKALNLKMDPGTIHLLKRHALDTNRTASDIVAEWVRIHLGELAESPRA